MAEPVSIPDSGLKVAVGKHLIGNASCNPREGLVVYLPPSVLAELSEEMDIFERFCGQKTFRLYTLMIDAPGANALHRKIFVSISVLILSVATIFQVLKFVTEGFTLKLLVVLLPTIAGILGSLVYIIHLTVATNMHLQYKYILRIMRFTLNQEKSPEEISINEQFATNTKMFINMYSAVLIFMLFGMVVSGFIPSFLDIIIPLNRSRKNELIYEGDIFLDQEKYFYYIYFFECLSAAATVSLVVVSVNMCVIIMQYSCSMGAVLGYQLENLTETGVEKMLQKINYEQLLIKNIKMCIRNHQTALKLGFLIAEFYDIPLTIMLVGSFCTLTMSLVQVTDPDLISMKMIVYTIAQLIQLFLVSLMGQGIIDASVQISDDAYSAKWDMCPPNVREMLQLVILRASKPCMVVARGLYIFSIENFMSVIQTVVSFYMVLRQSR